MCTLFGLSLCLYVQGNFINADYGVLDGRMIDWSQYLGREIKDAALWLAILALPVVIMFIKPNIGRKCIQYGSYLLLAIQLSAVMIMLIVNNGGQGTAGIKKTLTTEGLDEISENRNVIVFVLDTFDQDYFDEINQNDERYIEPLDGFVYFRNVTCMYPTTAGSLPYMLTGQINRNEMPLREYIREAFKKTDYYDLLSENGYSIGIYTDPLFVETDKGNRLICNYSESRPIVSSYAGLTKTLYQFAAFRFFPDALKRFVWLYSDEFNKWKKSGSFDNKELFSDDNAWYYNWLRSNPLKIQKDGNRYSVIHLNGPHPPFTLNENLETVTDGSADCISESKACLAIVYEYMAQLTKLGVYDNSLIIITADHGRTDELFTNPVLLIKPVGSRGKLKVSDAPVCHGDLQATVMEEIGLNLDHRFGESVFDIPEKDERQRQYFYYIWDGALGDYLPTLTEYSVDSEGNKESNFHFVASEYRDYTLGDKLSFIGDGTARQYWNLGLGLSEENATWMTGHEAVASFKFNKEIEKDLKVHFDYNRIYNDHQTVRAYANNILVMDSEINNPKTFEFIIPKGTIVNGKLKLRIEIPDAVSPRELGESGDKRLLSFYMTAMYLEETDPSESLKQTQTIETVN